MAIVGPPVNNRFMRHGSASTLNAAAPDKVPQPTGLSALRHPDRHLRWLNWEPAE